MLYDFSCALYTKKEKKTEIKIIMILYMNRQMSFKQVFIVYDYYIMEEKRA